MQIPKHFGFLNLLFDDSKVIGCLKSLMHHYVLYKRMQCKNQTFSTFHKLCKRLDQMSKTKLFQNLYTFGQQNLKLINVEEIFILFINRLQYYICYFFKFGKAR